MSEDPKALVKRGEKGVVVADGDDKKRIARTRRELPAMPTLPVDDNAVAIQESDALSPQGWQRIARYERAEIIVTWLSGVIASAGAALTLYLHSGLYVLLFGIASVVMYGFSKRAADAGDRARNQRLLSRWNETIGDVVDKEQAEANARVDAERQRSEDLRRALDADRAESQRRIETLATLAKRASPYESLAQAVEGGAVTISMGPFWRKQDGKVHIEFQIDNMSAFDITVQMDKGKFTLQSQGVANAWVTVFSEGLPTWSCGVPAFRARRVHRCEVPNEAFGRARIARLTVDAAFSAWIDLNSKVKVQAPAFECFPDPSV